MSAELNMVPGLLPAALPYLHGSPPSQGVIRRHAEDFEVIEIPAERPTGEGEHLYLLIEKRGHNTQWVASQLARLCQVKTNDVGFAGLKDRHACTQQWFSVWLPGREAPDLSELFAHEGVRLLEQARHGRKLKRGAHLGNRFRLRIREVSPSAELEARLAGIAIRGVPNYYGEQRFGREGGNLRAAQRMFCEGWRVRDRTKRGLYLSAARSHLFNQLVAARVEAGVFDRYLSGDRLMPAGTTELLSVEDSAAKLESVFDGSLHVTAPLWGRGRALVEDAALALETDILTPFASWLTGLEQAGLTRERRAVRMIPQGFHWQWLADDQLELRFVLMPGCFATSVLRECVDYRLDLVTDDETAAVE